MKTEEDAMIVIVIGDGDTDDLEGDTPVPMAIKQEISDETDTDFQIEYLMETAEQLGEKIEVDGLEFLLNKKIKQEDEHEDYLDSANSDYDYDPKEDFDDEKEGSKLNGSKRMRMLYPSERVSFIAEVRSEHPHYTEKDLIKHVATDMEMVKPPAPPEDSITQAYRGEDLALIYVCTICESETTTEPAAHRHYQEKHGPRYLVCFACGVDFRSTTNLYKHEKRCVAPDAKVMLRARAKALGFRAKRRPYLSLEQKTKHKKWFSKPATKHFPCTECSAMFLSKNALEAHQNLHRGERPYVCGFCGNRYTSNSALRRHEMQAHKNLKFICDHCNRVFKAKTSLVAHMNTHLPQKKYACEYPGCSRRFSQKAALQIHINGRHENLPPQFACKICPRRFVRMSLLKVHMKKTHGMTLMTRTMFIRLMPKLSKTLVEQGTVIFNHDSNATALYASNDGDLQGVIQRIGSDDDNDSIEQTQQDEPVYIETEVQNSTKANEVYIIGVETDIERMTVDGDASDVVEIKVEPEDTCTNQASRLKQEYELLIARLNNKVN